MHLTDESLSVSVRDNLRRVIGNVVLFKLWVVVVLQGYRWSA
ncbi:hypothetical protein [Phormidesmis priestleyi]